MPPVEAAVCYAQMRKQIEVETEQLNDDHVTQGVTYIRNKSRKRLEQTT